MEDDRWKCPTRAELVAALDKLLETPRAKSEGGDWPKVSRERLEEIHSYFASVLRAVTEPDLDGDMVISTYLVDRSKYMAPPIPLVPWHIENDNDLRQYICAASTLASASQGLLQHANLHLSEKTRAEQKT